jgi:hypothetical protein
MHCVWHSDVTQQQKASSKICDDDEGLGRNMQKSKVACMLEVLFSEIQTITGTLYSYKHATK